VPCTGCTNGSYAPDEIGAPPWFSFSHNVIIQTYRLRFYDFNLNKIKYFKAYYVLEDVGLSSVNLQ